MLAFFGTRINYYSIPTNATRARDIEAISFLALVSIGLGRLIIEAAEPLAAATGGGMADSSIWYLVPVAGGALPACGLW